MRIVNPATLLRHKDAGFVIVFPAQNTMQPYIITVTDAIWSCDMGTSGMHLIINLKPRSCHLHMVFAAQLCSSSSVVLFQHLWLVYPLF